ncbi:MAG TPA: hypothetical protein VM364_14265 [Vicinamibacterales bacterium]|nr:hypothetical protein [Vicinamibacterales bacterium]
MERLRFAARDPGGANVLAAWARTHPLPHALTADAWTMERATPRFEGLGLPVRQFDSSGLDALRAAWAADPATILVTGTSHYEPFESVLWEIAREAGVPSLALLDTWGNVAARFTRSRPDAVGALDASQVAELLDGGFELKQILLAGHPWLREMKAKRPAAAPAGRTNEVRVLFVSEAIASDVASGFNRPFGFDEFDAFALVHAAAGDAARGGCAVDLQIRLHPYEDPAAFAVRLREVSHEPGVRVAIADSSQPPHVQVEQADLVCGMTSILLIEAMVLGRPVISVQPGLLRENTFEPAVRGWTDTLVDPGAARARCAELMTDPNARRELLLRHQGMADGLCGDSTAVEDWLRANSRAWSAA